MSTTFELTLSEIVLLGARRRAESGRGAADAAAGQFHAIVLVGDDPMWNGPAMSTRESGVSAALERVAAMVPPQRTRLVVSAGDAHVPLGLCPHSVPCDRGTAASLLGPLIDVLATDADGVVVVAGPRVAHTLVARATELLRLYVAAVPRMVRMFVFAASLPAREQTAFMVDAFATLPDVDLIEDVLRGADRYEVTAVPSDGLVTANSPGSEAIAIGF